MQKIQFDQDFAPVHTQSLEELVARKRFFSLDTKEFPQLGDVEKAIDKRQGSGQKTESGLSTIDSILEDHPVIREERQGTSFADYMTAKDRTLLTAKRVSSSNVVIDAPVLLLHWKLKPASFFRMERRSGRISPVQDEEDWEYLSNPDRLEMTADQKSFVRKFYPEATDPYSVLNWLHQKAVDYQTGKADQKISNLDYSNPDDQMFAQDSDDDDQFSNLSESLLSKQDWRDQRLGKGKSTHSVEEGIKVRAAVAQLKARNIEKKRQSMRQSRPDPVSAREAYRASPLFHRLKKTFNVLNRLRWQSACPDTDEALLESFHKMSSITGNV